MHCTCQVVSIKIEISQLSHIGPTFRKRSCRTMTWDYELSVYLHLIVMLVMVNRMHLLIAKVNLALDDVAISNLAKVICQSAHSKLRQGK